MKNYIKTGSLIFGFMLMAIIGFSTDFKEVKKNVKHSIEQIVQPNKYAELFSQADQSFNLENPYAKELAAARKEFNGKFAKEITAISTMTRIEYMELLPQRTFKLRSTERLVSIKNKSAKKNRSLLHRQSKYSAREAIFARRIPQEE